MTQVQPRNRGAAGRGMAWAAAPAATRGEVEVQALNRAPDSIPALMKPGEFVLPPDTVAAVGGPKALQGVVDATHTPAPAVAVVPRGMKPELFFANGGVVEDEGRRPNSFGDAAAAASIPNVTQVPSRAPVASTPQQPASPADSPAPATGAVIRVGNSYSGGNVGGDVSISDRTAGGSGARGMGSVAGPGSGPVDASPAPSNWSDAIAKVEAMGFKQNEPQPAAPSPAPMAKGMGALTGNSASPGPIAPSATLGAQPGAPAANVAASKPSATGGDLPAPSQSTISATQPDQVAPGVYQHGRGQYSNQASGMGMSAVFTGQPNAQNLQAAQALSDRSQQESVNRVTARGMGAVGGPGSGPVEPGSFTGGYSGTIGGGSGNMMSRTPEQQRRDAEVQSTSILRSTAERGRAALTGLDALDQQASRNAGSLDAANVRENAGLQREGMQQQGENTRSRFQMEMADIRERRAAGQQATQNDLARQRLVLDTERASRDGVPSGYRSKADGAGLEAIPGGPADPSTPKGKGTLNEGQAKALAFGARMQQSGQTLDALAANGVDQPGYIKRMADTVGVGALANWTQSPEQQQVEQGQRDFVNGVLRRESGAAISESEFSNARRQYFPQPGDSPAVIEQKRRNRDLSTRGVLAEVPDGQNRVQQVAGQPQQQQRTVTRTGMHNGRKVTQFSDGSISYAD